MEFIPLTRRNVREAAAFIRPYEALCTQLASRVRLCADGIYMARTAPSGGGRPRTAGVISCRSTVLHCLPFARAAGGAASALRAEFAAAFAEFSGGAGVLCVNGEESGTALILRALSGLCVPEQVNSYDLMTLDAAAFAAAASACPRPPEGFRIVRCRAPDADADRAQKSAPGRNAGRALRRAFFSGVSAPGSAAPAAPAVSALAAAGRGDGAARSENTASPEGNGPSGFERLFGLQEQYEIEEVLPAGRTFDGAACRLRLRHALNTQYILALEAPDGAYVSKAGTNAVGFGFAQIGGVFTPPAARRRGYARAVVSALAEKILQGGRRPVLFVKKENGAAAALYHSLGFRKICGYTIAYFRQNP